jgi:hypothetical protein
MSQKTFSLTAGLIFALIALGHVLRAVFALQWTVQGRAIPVGKLGGDSCCRLPGLPRVPLSQEVPVILPTQPTPHFSNPSDARCQNGSAAAGAGQARG